MEKLKPMDVYSELSVPFELAAYCRGRKLSVEAVNLSRALVRLTSAREAARKAEVLLENAEKDVAVKLDQVRLKMERDPV